MIILPRLDVYQWSFYKYVEFQVTFYIKYATNSFTAQSHFLLWFWRGIGSQILENLSFSDLFWDWISRNFRHNTAILRCISVTHPFFNMLTEFQVTLYIKHTANLSTAQGHFLPISGGAVTSDRIILGPLSALFAPNFRIQCALHNISTYTVVICQHGDVVWYYVVYLKLEFPVYGVLTLFWHLFAFRTKLWCLAA